MAAMAVAAIGGLAGCQGGGNSSAGAISGMGGGNSPVQLLNPLGNSGGEGRQAGNDGQAVSLSNAAAPSLRMPLDKHSLARAIELYRLNKKQKKSPYRAAGADINGDGRAEALVLLEGEDWCANTGCTLAIFIHNRFGYRPIATIRRVRGPVIIANERQNGWSNLVVGTGLPKYDNRVVLRFGANGYPGNAVILTPLPRDVEVAGEVLIEKADIPPLEAIASQTP